MCARNEILRSAGQGVVKRRLKAASCSRAVVMGFANHSRHVLLGAPHLFGLCSLGNGRVPGTLRVHLRLIAGLWHWRLAVTQRHRAVQMNLGNPRLDGHGTDLVTAHHCLGGRRLFRGKSIPSGSGDVSSGHGTQRVIDWVTRNARRIHLSAS